MRLPEPTEPNVTVSDPSKKTVFLGAGIGQSTDKNGQLTDQLPALHGAPKARAQEVGSCGELEVNAQPVRLLHLQPCPLTFF